MRSYPALCDHIVHYAILSCTMRSNSALCDLILHYAILSCTMRSNSALCDLILHYAILSCTMRSYSALCQLFSALICQLILVSFGHQINTVKPVFKGHQHLRESVRIRQVSLHQRFLNKGKIRQLEMSPDQRVSSHLHIP